MVDPLYREIKSRIRHKAEAFTFCDGDERWYQRELTDLERCATGKVLLAVGGAVDQNLRRPIWRALRGAD